jgi:nucleotide-binding universal stress UspA family protein
MALKNLLLNVDHTAACAGRIDAAVALAAEHGAHLTALYCIGIYHLSRLARGPENLRDQGPGLAERDAQAALATFTNIAEAAGISYETRTARVPTEMIADQIALHARYADLAVVGQLDPDEPPPGGRHIVEHVLLACGRPVLVIPYIGPPRHDGETVFGREIIAAWDAGREATRAINDALPLLERAGRVELVTINTTKRLSQHGADAGADIALQLARHDVRVEVNYCEAREISVGDLLLARLSDAGSDMLVMGGYGHSRVRELVLGGVTRSVLDHMTVPVLMSH